MNNQLIPVFNGDISNETTLLCNARDLHKFLGVGKVFAAWITARLEEYGFVENHDFILLSNFGKQTSGRGGSNRKEYHLTLDTAKELAMVERNDKGRQVRRYFIECEKRLLQEAIARRPARKRIAPPAIDTKRFIGCFAAIETAWSQIHKDLLIIDPVSAREVGDLMDTVLRVGRTYQANALSKLR
ncbi:MULTISPECIES: antA/AntB antirepressor family protein [unclassified Serratia (in: enterobacteria)]|uniref:antA/AntB antirepressor family protein n=1 Tax=unclassified Serratia (in: enterobacteria) TaxID=2647522 RepID=UPI0030761D9C